MFSETTGKEEVTIFALPPWMDWIVAICEPRGQSEQVKHLRTSLVLGPGK